MTLHTEWDTARGCEIGAATREEANEEWALDQAVDDPCVLVLGGGGGGCLAVEGSRDELVRFAERVAEAVAALPVSQDDEKRRTGPRTGVVQSSQLGDDWRASTHLGADEGEQ